MSSVLLAGSHSTCVSESSVIWRHEKPKGPAGRSRHHPVTAQGVCAVSNLFQRPGVGRVTSVNPGRLGATLSWFPHPLPSSRPGSLLCILIVSHYRAAHTMAPFPAVLDGAEHRVYARAVADTLRPNDTQEYSSLGFTQPQLTARVTLIVAGCYIVVIGLCRCLRHEGANDSGAFGRSTSVLALNSSGVYCGRLGNLMLTAGIYPCWRRSYTPSSSSRSACMSCA